jgi:lysocardiolipin and lysophospholipid acyltransferase
LLVQSELDLLAGKMPDEVHFLVERIDQQDMPRDELALKSWLENRWQRKEQVLEDFYANKAFKSEPWPAPRKTPLNIAFVFWTLLSGEELTLVEECSNLYTYNNHQYNCILLYFILSSCILKT